MMEGSLRDYASAVEEGPSPDLCLFDDLCGQAQTRSQDCVPLNLHNDVIDDSINGVSVGNKWHQDGGK
jgi:hypothetical protein